MRREYKTIEQQTESEWRLLVSLPLTKDILDDSGNGKHATLTSGSVSYVTFNGDTYCNAQNGVIRLQSPQQGDYINNFKIELDFVWLADNPRYFCLIDGNDDGSKYKGIMVGSSYGSLFAFGIRYANSSANDGVYGYTPSKSTIKFNKKYHLEMVNYNNTCSVKLTDEDGNVLEGQKATPTYTVSQLARTYIQLGTDSRYGTGRKFNGYFKNFKLYEHY